MDSALKKQKADGEAQGGWMGTQLTQCCPPSRHPNPRFKFCRRLSPEPTTLQPAEKVRAQGPGEPSPLSCPSPLPNPSLPLIPGAVSSPLTPPSQLPGASTASPDPPCPVPNAFKLWSP